LSNYIHIDVCRTTNSLYLAKLEAVVAVDIKFMIYDECNILTDVDLIV